MPHRLTRETFVTPATMAEGVYDALIHHVSARLAPFVEMITHSATVNHGGGLRKEKERVYANPCHYAQAMLRELAGARLLAVEIEAGAERAPGVLSHAQSVGLASKEQPVIDALAGLADDGSLLVSLVHRGTQGPVSLRLETTGFRPRRATMRLLTAEKPWLANTLDAPDRIVPTDMRLSVRGGAVALDLPPFSVALMRLTPA